AAAVDVFPVPRTAFGFLAPGSPGFPVAGSSMIVLPSGTLSAVSSVLAAGAAPASSRSRSAMLSDVGPSEGGPDMSTDSELPLAAALAATGAGAGLAAGFGAVATSNPTVNSSGPTFSFAPSCSSTSP